MRKWSNFAHAAYIAGGQLQLDLTAVGLHNRGTDRKLKFIPGTLCVPHIISLKTDATYRESAVTTAPRGRS